MKFRQYTFFCGAIPFTTHPPLFGTFSWRKIFFGGLPSVVGFWYRLQSIHHSSQQKKTLHYQYWWILNTNSNYDWIKSMIGTESIDCYYWVVFGGQGLSPSYPIIRWIEWYWVSGGWVGGYPLPLPCVWFLPVIRRWVGVIQTIRPHHQQGKVKSGHHLQLIKWEFTKTTYTVATSQWHCPIALQLHPTCGKSPKFL